MGDHFRFKPTALYITLGQGNPKKLKPKRYMNPFLCFAHEERKKSRGGHLLSDWKAAHKGLGGKWRALGTGKLKFHHQGKVPPFTMFVKHCPQRKEILPAWTTAHKGLGGTWRGMDNVSKEKYFSASKQLKGSYDQQMKVYSKKRQELVKAIRIARLARTRANRALKKQSKLNKVQAKKSSKKLKRQKRP